MKQILLTADRDIRIDCLERPFDFRSPFDGKEFVLMLVVIDTTINAAEQHALSVQIVEQGCRYAVCAGHQCSTWDDSIDMTLLYEHPDYNSPDDKMIMTTWHDNEPYDDIVYYFLNLTSFNEFVAERFIICCLGRNAGIESEIERRVSDHSRRPE